MCLQRSCKEMRCHVLPSATADEHHQMPVKQRLSNISCSRQLAPELIYHIAAVDRKLARLKNVIC